MSSIFREVVEREKRKHPTGAEVGSWVTILEANLRPFFSTVVCVGLLLGLGVENLIEEGPQDCFVISVALDKHVAHLSLELLIAF